MVTVLAVYMFWLVVTVIMSLLEIHRCDTREDGVGYLCDRPAPSRRLGGGDIFSKLVQKLFKNGSTVQNRALLWGVAGVFAGVIFAASVLFRRYEKRFIDSVPEPFIEDE